MSNEPGMIRGLVTAGWVIHSKYVYEAYTNYKLMHDSRKQIVELTIRPNPDENAWKNAEQDLTAYKQKVAAEAAVAAKKEDE